MRSEIGLCVRTLFYKEWGKTFVFADGSALRRGRIRSQDWWERRLKSLTEDPTVIELNLGPEPGLPFEIPIRYEDEFGMNLYDEPIR